MSRRYDSEAVRSRLAMPQLCEQLGIVLRQSGPRWTGCCPFHVERTASFTVSCEDKRGWHFHCFGCAAHGDIFDLWSLRQGGDFKSALSALAGIAGLGPVPENWTPQKPLTAAVASSVPKKVVRFPKLRRLSDATCQELAVMRGLDVAAVLAARDAGLIWGAEMGVSVRSGLVWGEAMEKEGECGKLRVGPARCWIVADGAGLAVQARRLDGEPWPKHRGGSFKAWTIGTAKWPLGITLAGKRRCVALVEGGPDILAAFQFLVRAQKLHSVAVVGVLGASVRLHEDSLAHFKDRRVRIFAHVDKEDPKTGQRSGWEAAARWTEQLVNAGAEVDVWDFSDLLRRDGQSVSDLNDAALGDDVCLREMATAMNFKPSILFPDDI